MTPAIRLPVIVLIILVAVRTLPAREPAKDQPDAVRPAAGRWERVRKLIQGHVDKREIAGAVVLVQERGKPVYYEAIGQSDVDANKPMIRDTIFRIASMSKPITSVAVMMLVEEGKLGLDDPLSKHIPEFTDMTVLVPTKEGYRLVKAERAITIRQLLTHTSGIIYRFSGRLHLAKLYTEAGVSDGLTETEGTIGENVKRIAKLPLLHQPGTTWEYGLNTDVLGRVVEIASGKTLDEFFRERIFAPMQMRDTGFVVPKEKRSRLAALYTPDEKKTIRRVGNEPIRVGSLVYSATYPTADNSRYYSGGAGLVSTAHDYGRFLQMMLNRGELDGKRLLKPETVDQMTRNQIGDQQIAFSVHGDGFGYGFGVVTGREKPASPAPVGSYSWGGIFNTFFWVDPRRQLIGIVLTQLYPFDHLSLWKNVQSKVYEVLSAEQNGKKSAAPPKTNPDALRQAAMNRGGDPKRGKAVFFSQTAKCATCHKVQSQGVEVGPDLSLIGGKFDRTHLIESLLDPSAEILQGYHATLLTTKSGRVLTGIAKSESSTSLTLLDAEGKSNTIAFEDIESREVSKVSLMPAGLCEGMTAAEFTDLIAYLTTLRTGRELTPGEGNSGALALPECFKAEVVAAGFNGATALELAPDGRIFVCEQTGTLRVIKDGKLLAKPFVKLPVEATWERGLIGVTVAPDFPKTPHVFVCYVTATPYPHHVVSRFTARGDEAEPGSEKILLEGDDQTRLGGTVPAGHQGGALHFGRDGKLYIAIGDQTAGKPAQESNSLLGRLLRINPDGSIPNDNPFSPKAYGKYRSSWVLGLRNPFTFAIQPKTGRLFINDVGGNAEEINEGIAGANYGWPTVEHGPTTDSRFRGPIHHYPTACISGGAFAPTDIPWPKDYRGQYFFADFNHGWIKFIDPDKPTAAKLFASGLRRPVDLRFTPDGSLYVLLRDAWVIDHLFKGGTGVLLRIGHTVK
ncbi:MAG TPA: serine hydrolase [Gemmataceae bacterium]|jgi:putative heme-binding domain-containing protein